MTLIVSFSDNESFYKISLFVSFVSLVELVIMSFLK